MEIRQIMAYAENARQKLRETLKAHPEAWNQPWETTGPNKTIAQLTAHLVGAEERWTEGRLYGNPPPGRYEERTADTQDGLFEDWDAVRARTLAFAESADAAALGRAIATQMGNPPQSLTLTAAEILFHLANHQSWHLGQISMALQQQEIDPPNFDYVILREFPSHLP